MGQKFMTVSFVILIIFQYDLYGFEVLKMKNVLLFKVNRIKKPVK